MWSTAGGGGYAVASINEPERRGAIPAQIHDVKAAARWLRASRAEVRAGPERVGAWGAFAGGHLVLLDTSVGVDEFEGDAGHGFGGPDIEQRVLEFFDRHLKSGD